MEEELSTRLELPKDFDIDDAPLEDEDASQLQGGSIEIWTPDYSEKRKVRPYIAGIIVIVWGIGVIASAVRAFIAGDVLIIVPPAIITVPLMAVLKFYFRSD